MAASPRCGEHARSTRGHGDDEGTSIGSVKTVAEAVAVAVAPVAVVEMKGPAEEEQQLEGRVATGSATQR